MDEPSPDRLVHFYDELTEAQAVLKTEEYRAYLTKWGVSESAAANYCARFDPKRTGFIKREDICTALNCYPNPPAILREVEILTTDMSAKKRESILLLILDGTHKKKSKQDRLQEIKERIERVYGSGWNVFMADGRYWSVCSHKPGTNLVFVHKGMVYGVHQTPAPEEAERDNCSVAH
ncbi:unnamed protein product [Dibothriocephalus latus]|uniref:EF-hand domain-containing protein n=1 Tax=Dibothriocephalus latus TaxID=60516 RepID=A0A3P7P0S2_DIBLA|nr:unnamed protein product [Dibothriocephalus latus]